MNTFFKEAFLLPIWLPGLVPDETIESWGIPGLRQRRLDKVSSYLIGRVLDIGSGNNLLIQQYRQKGNTGWGVDVFPWNLDLDGLADGSTLPFHNRSFNTVSFIACLNHIPNREMALHEANRILKPGGRVVITMIDPVIGWIGHKFLWGWDPDLVERGMKPDETNGLWISNIKNMLNKAGFQEYEHFRFLFGLNNLLVAYKTD